ncbi:ribosome recycling factor [Candidatus Parcubacteria bacterium]|jgi:ribosome recycling factor|nr:ribosome recycling factor [Candidatus Parcubacteria bacterium]
MNSIVQNNKDQYEKTLEFLQGDISSLRTGRVAPNLVEAIQVESYGTTSDLMQLAAISTPEPRTISIKPWDKNILKDIERALAKSDLNVNPIVDGDIVRLNFPSLTEESRKELVKILSKKLEEARIALRSQREKIKEDVISLEKSKEISEDEKFQALKELDDMTKEYNEKIKELGDSKEKEIMTI